MSQTQRAGSKSSVTVRKARRQQVLRKGTCCTCHQSCPNDGHEFVLIQKGPGPPLPLQPHRHQPLPFCRGRELGSPHPQPTEPLNCSLRDQLSSTAPLAGAARAVPGAWRAMHPGTGLSSPLSTPTPPLSFPEGICQVSARWNFTLLF